MSGSAGMRGYFVQALIAGYESLNLNDGWIQIGFEPDGMNEKVDVLWVYPGHRKATQIKSSRNPVERNRLEAWCREVLSTPGVDEHELLIVGSCPARVIDEAEKGGVRIPRPRDLRISGLLEQLAYRLGAYAEQRELGPLPARLSLLHARALVARFAEHSSDREYVSREQFDAEIAAWIASIPGPRRAQASTGAIRLFPKNGDEIRVPRSVAETRGTLVYLGMSAALALAAAASSQAWLGGQGVWSLPALAFGFVLYVLNRDLLRLANPKQVERERGIFLGDGRLARLNVDGEYVISRPTHRCVDPDCDDGWIVLDDAPPREPPHHRFVGVCTENGRDHSYRILKNGKAKLHPVDWRPLPPPRDAPD